MDIKFASFIFYYVLCGGFGGFVHGVTCPASYQIKLPFSSKTPELGILGDIFAGMAAAMAVFFLVTILPGFQVDLDLMRKDANDQQAQPAEPAQPPAQVKPDQQGNPPQAAAPQAKLAASKTQGTFKFRDLLQYLSIAVIAGYLGIRVLSAAAKGLGDRLDDVQNRITSLNVSTQTQRLLAEASQALQSADPVKAELRYSQVLALDPDNPDAKIGKAKLLAKSAVPKALDTAIALAKEVLAKMPENPTALYNLARFEIQRDPANKKDVADLLAKAVKSLPEFAKYAKGDDTFKSLHGDPAFDKVVGSVK